MKRKERFRLLRKPKQYSIADVLQHVEANTNKKTGPQIDFDGDTIRMGSQRYQVFKYKGTRCVGCGVQGRYFFKEKHYPSSCWHFNLYAVDGDGNEVLMTKDHIVPKARGGRDILDNYQPMCAQCNALKADTIGSEMAGFASRLELIKFLTEVQDGQHRNYHREHFDVVEGLLITLGRLNRFNPDQKFSCTDVVVRATTERVLLPVDVIRLSDRVMQAMSKGNCNE